MTETSVDRNRFRTGHGNWNGLVVPVERLVEIATGWADLVRGVERPWLCWNVNADWCLVQQDLVAHAGWTPIVGGDPRAGRPPLRRDAIWIDFNERLQLPTVFMHVPLELMFLWAPRLAFWHSDLIVRPAKLTGLARSFEAIPDGEMAAIRFFGGSWRELPRFRRHRYWELIGCTTRGASRSQFEHGCGWWMNFHLHPNVRDERERRRRSRYYFDHGTGIMFWARNFGGRVRRIPISLVGEGHFSRRSYLNVPPSLVGGDQSRRTSLEAAFAAPRNEKTDVTKEIDHWDLGAICREFEVLPALESIDFPPGRAPRHLVDVNRQSA